MKRLSCLPTITIGACLGSKRKLTNKPKTGEDDKASLNERNQRLIIECYSTKNLRHTKGFKWQFTILFSNLKLEFLDTGLMVPK